MFHFAITVNAKVIPKMNVGSYTWRNDIGLTCLCRDKWRLYYLIAHQKRFILVVVHQQYVECKKLFVIKIQINEELVTTMFNTSS
jgi:hypothetical protein